MLTESQKSIMKAWYAPTKLSFRKDGSVWGKVGHRQYRCIFTAAELRQDLAKADYLKSGK